MGKGKQLVTNKFFLFPHYFSKEILFRLVKSRKSVVKEGVKERVKERVKDNLATPPLELELLDIL